MGNTNGMTTKEMMTVLEMVRIKANDYQLIHLIGEIVTEIKRRAMNRVKILKQEGGNK